MYNFFKHCKNNRIARRLLLLPVLIAFVLCGTLTRVQAQRLFPKKTVYTQAQEYFHDRKYFEAAQLFEQYLSDEKSVKGVSDPFLVRKRGKDTTVEVRTPRHDATYNLAESYRLTHDFTQAEKWYGEASALPGHNPLSEYWYGVTLRTNKKYDSAEKVLTTFINNYPKDDEWKDNAYFELENLQFIRDQAANNPVHVTVKPEQNNLNRSAYALVIPDKKAFVFTSIYVDSSAMKKGKYAYFARLYNSVSGGNVMDSARVLPIASPQGYHEGLATFDKEGKTMIFTRWNDKDGKRISALYRTTKTETGWSTPEKLSAPFNIEGSNSTQPFITSDQKYLLFSSNRPGGSGLYDIWYAQIDQNLNSVQAINMGNTINTAKDDMSPFYHQNTGQLLFSSNGRVGMGGFDIYSSAGDFNVLQWQNVTNPGAPINSSKDDLYFISTDNESLWGNGWLSSDRNSDCCLEMFAYNRANSQYFSGVVVDKVSGLPIPGAVINLRHLLGVDANGNPNGAEVAKQDGEEKENSDYPFDPLTVIADSLGRYHFSLTNTKKVQVKAGKPGYDSVIASYEIAHKTGTDSLAADTILLSPTRIHDPDLVQSGTDPPDRSPTGDLHDPDTTTGTAFDPDPTNSMGPKTKPEPGLSIGTINSQLIHFDFDKTIIKEEYYSILDQIAELMNNQPSLSLNINGHTDAFGSNDYNDRLGRLRSEAVISYLSQKGVDADRFSAISFGEVMPIASETVNGSDDAQGRFMNRRVEFSVINAETATSAEAPKSISLEEAFMQQSNLPQTGTQNSNNTTGSPQSQNDPQYVSNTTNTLNSDMLTTKKANEKSSSTAGKQSFDYASVSAPGSGSEFAIIVHYSFDKSVINNSYYRSLDTLAQILEADPSLKLVVNGHTDTRGSDAYNNRLANERVQSCIRYLQNRGIATARLTGNAYGECCPVADEKVDGKDDPHARWRNRRVEFKWLTE